MEIQRRTGIVRMLCLAAAVTLMISLFAGCKKTTESASSAPAVSEAVTSYENTEIIELYEKDDNIPETADLGGFEMVFATPATSMIIPTEGKSAEGDLILEALRKTQEAYNCVISVKEVPQDGWNEAMTAILSGEEFANVMMPCVHQSGAFIQSRLCANYLSSEISQYIKMEDPWWNDTMAYASNVLGEVYAGAPCINSPADSTFVLFFNKNIAANVGIGENELYDLWDAKKWTWDAFVKYAKMAMKDLDGSGAVDSANDQWGFVAPGYDSAQAFCSSAKVASITTTDGMNPTYTFNTSHAITALTKLNALYTTDNIYCLESWQKSSYMNMFSEGHGLFLGYSLGVLSNDLIRDMEDDFGLLTYPLGPDENSSTGWQEKYMSRVDHNFRLTLIPSTVEDKTSTALVLESMAFNYWKIINDKVDTYANLYCRDDKSVEIANSVYNTSSFEISQFLYSINSGAWNAQVETKIRDVVNNANYDVSGSMLAVADQAQQMITDYFAGV